MVGQGEQDLGEAAVECCGAARLEIGAATTVDEQGVTGEGVHRIGGLPHKAHAAGGVARRVQGLQGVSAKTQARAVAELHRSGANATALGRSGLGACQLGELARAGDVIGVGVRFHRPHQLQAMFTQDRQIALDLLVDRVDDQGLSAVLIKQHIGVGA